MSDPVERLNAALEGRYAIERELGEGGMATVYLADDIKHNLFGPLHDDVRLKHVSTRSFPSGLVQVKYRTLE